MFAVTVVLNPDKPERQVIRAEFETTEGAEEYIQTTRNHRNLDIAREWVKVPSDYHLPRSESFREGTSGG